MKKIIGTLVMVSFLFMSCAHGPQKVPEDMTPTQEEGRSLGELSAAERAEDWKKIKQADEFIEQILAAAFVVTIAVILFIGPFFL
jgi:hypothetical protein